jgi:hypothetical protein
VSDLHAVRTQGLRALLTCSYLCDVQTAIGAPARIPQLVIAALRSVPRSTRWAASEAAFSIKELDIGLAADTDMLMRVSKLVANASLLHELALSVRTFGAEEAQCSLGLVSRVVPCLRAEARTAIVEFCRGRCAEETRCFCED